MKELFGMNLSQILKSAVRESIDDIIGDEKVKQKKTADALKGFKAKKKSSSSPESADVDEAEEAEPSSDKSGLKDPVTPKETALPEITLDKVIDLVGSIRAGKSLKEKEVLREVKAEDVEEEDEDIAKLDLNRKVNLAKADIDAQYSCLLQAWPTSKKPCEKTQDRIMQIVQDQYV